MSLPTESTIQALIGYVAILFRDHDYQLTDVTNGWTTREEVVLNALEQDSPQVAAALSAIRASLAGSLSGQSVRSVCDPLWQTYARVLNIPYTDSATIIREIQKNFAENSKYIPTRSISFGSPAAGGSNVGTGALYRLTTDRWGNDIETPYEEAKTFECVADEHSGATEHEELFRFTGSAFGRDILDTTGTGQVVNFRALSARDSILLNPSFSSYGGDSIAAPTSITNWTIDSGANYALDETYYYRDYQGDTTPRSLKFTESTSISQNLNVRRSQLSADTPYRLQLAYNRSQYSGDGTLTITFGNVSANVVLAAQSGWNILSLDLDSDAWFKNFNKEDLKVTIALSGNTTGDVLIDDVLLVPFSNLDGTWYCLVGGATPFLKDDVFTLTDSASEAILQDFINTYYGNYLPASTSTNVTWSDPQ